MTDTHPTQSPGTQTPNPNPQSENAAGRKRPDQGGAPAGKEQADPSTGGKGSAGAGGSGGFGT